jgi:uncharacterized protein (DUF1499 family)
MSALTGLLAAVIMVPLLVGCETTMTMVFGPVQRETISFATFDPGTRTNRYLVCPAGYCAATTPERTSPVFEVSAAALQERWMAMIERQPRITPGPADTAARQYDFIQRSRLLGFPDTITIRFIALGVTKSTVAIYSRSHYGSSDFGVNRDRIEAWLAELSPSNP